MHIELDLSALAADMEAMGMTVARIEAGLGADGVGHGVLKPPAEFLLEEHRDGLWSEEQ
ncbi:hypothetical protein [Vulcanococcus limneticus]|uniref:hypothetical protein n=1 Tax=Vulcanococcus limneticus TaxID=2170428 RepID=UPI00398C1CB2